MSAENAAPGGRHIVASWVYGVINPLLDILPIEISFLERGNVTFRFYRGRLEFIKPFSAHVAPPSRRLLADFLHADKDARERFAAHDELVQGVERAAGDAFAAIVTREFTELALGRLAEWTDRGNPYPGGAYPKDRFPLLIAQHVINCITELPEDLTDAAFWKLYGAEFRAFGTGPAFESLATERSRLLDLDKELIPWLEEESRTLRVPHDLPAAPPPYHYPPYPPLPQY